ncbi:TPA: hypothetical protein ACS9WW_004167 [Salmonella enterica subsp. enterica serovar Muenchen]
MGDVPSGPEGRIPSGVCPPGAVQPAVCRQADIPVCGEVTAGGVVNVTPGPDRQVPSGSHAAVIYRIPVNGPEADVPARLHTAAVMYFPVSAYLNVTRHGSRLALHVDAQPFLRSDEGDFIRVHPAQG